jgi:TPR repeat protein
MNKQFAVLALAALFGCAQAPTRAPMSPDAAARRHAEGLALQQRGDEKGAFIAFLEAAEHGNPPAQRRLGEIYDTGNSAVERDYSESIRWYGKARENGEPVPAQPKIPSSPTAPTPRAWY